LDCSCCCNVLFFFFLLPWKSGTQTCLFFFSQLMNDQTCESNVFFAAFVFVFQVAQSQGVFFLNDDSWQIKILQVVVLIS
jgi:hypothetical protein